jgi:hypothetical protein
MIIKHIINPSLMMAINHITYVNLKTIVVNNYIGTDNKLELYTGRGMIFMLNERITPNKQSFMCISLWGNSLIVWD